MPDRPDFAIIRSGDANYPAALKEIPNPPLKLYARGGFDLDSRPHIAIVGTRKATAQGLTIARSFAKELSAAGAVIVSGLALGIDGAAHEGALDAKGRTIAVLPVGIDRIYPVHHENLAARMLRNSGALISEYDPGMPSIKNHFLERNRIVSGLSLGIIVIEAPEKSGALATATHALEQNREIFVVPGPANHENYKGSHALIRAGARLVTTAAEVLDDLNLAPMAPATLPFQEAMLGETPKAIVSAIRSAGEAVPVDKIGDLTKMDVSVVTRNLTLLIIQGIVKESGGRYYL